MKKMMRTTAVLGMIVLLATSAWADNEKNRDLGQLAGAQIRGAWKVTFTAEEGGPPPFLVLMVLTRDGAVVETDAGPPNPLQFSPGIGEWQRRADGYAISYTQMEFDAGQNHTGMFNALMNVKLSEDGDTLEGTVRVRFFDLSDTLLFEGAGTVEGTRLPID